MKILLDINHPADVHYFRNFIKIMEGRGHSFMVVNRDSRIINELLDYYGIRHVKRNPRPKSRGTLAHVVNLARMVAACMKASLKFRPDIYLGFASSACAVTSFVFRKPCILIDDTEHNSMNHKVYTKFCSCVLTPFYFRKNLGKRQLYFNAFCEQMYLRKSLYSPSADILGSMGVGKGEYVLVRYISYRAHHDIGVRQLGEETRRSIVERLSGKYRVFVSHETYPNPYGEFALKAHPAYMHDLEANAKFVVTEGATTASESFVLGVPTLYINPLHLGYTDIQAATFPNVFVHTTDPAEIEKAISRLEKAEAVAEASAIRDRLEACTIDPTEFLVWFVENYPESETTLRANPHYQDRFASAAPLTGSSSAATDTTAATDAAPAASPTAAPAASPTAAPAAASTAAADRNISRPIDWVDGG